MALRVGSNFLRTAIAGSLLAAMLMSHAAMAARGLPPIKESQAEASAAQQGSVEARVQRLETLLKGQALVEMLTRMDELQMEVQDMRSQNEVLMHELSGIKKRQRELYMDIDRRLRQLAASPTGAVQEPSTGGSAIDVDAAMGGGSEDQSYQDVFEMLKDGRYEDAIKGFNAFLAAYPESSYAGNAQYWLGEANYVLQRFSDAQREFEKVIKGYAESTKVPDALLKLGYTHYEQEQWGESRKTLGRLVKDFPKSTAAKLATNRLNRMNLEGR